MIYFSLLDVRYSKGVWWLSAGDINYKGRIGSFFHISRNLGAWKLDILYNNLMS